MFPLSLDFAGARHACLRAWRQDDLADLVAHADTAARVPYPFAGGDGRGWLDAAVRDPNGRWALELDGRAVGGVSLHGIGDGVFELGFWLGRRLWRRGIMTRVIALFVPEAMRTFRLHRLFATVYADNPASARVLEKCGFTSEGLRKSAIIGADGALDIRVYALTRGEGR